MLRLPALLSTLILCSYGQVSIQGLVKDPTGAPVHAADVRLTRVDNTLQLQTRSGIDGRYSFDHLPAGEYWLEARTATLEQAEPLRITAGAAGPAAADLVIVPARVATRIQVTGSLMAQSTIEAGKALDVLEAEDLDRRAEFSLTEALRVVPGLRVQQLGGPGTFTRILTRGLRATDTSVLVDGLRFRDAGAVQGDAAAFLGDLLMGGVERIEVLRGSGSSLYGTHATGGVVNLVTLGGGGPFHAEFTNEGGGLGLYRGLAKFSGSALDGRLLYGGGANHLNVSRGTEGLERVRNWGGQGSAQWRVRPATSLSLRFLGATSMVSIGTNPQPAAAAALPPTGIVPAVAGVTFIPNQYDPDSRRIADFASVAAVWSEQLASNAMLRVSYQGLGSHRDNRNGPAGAGYQTEFNNSTAYGGRIDTVNARADVTLARRHYLTFGYEFERENYDNPSRDENPDPAQRVNARTEATQRSHSAFAQDQIRWLDSRLQLSLSGRFQRFAMDAPLFTGGAPQYAGVKLSTPPDALTGDAALSYVFASTSTKLRAHAGNAYRAPSLYERFGAYFFFGAFGALGDPRLRPERSLGFDIGADQYLANNRLRASASVFYTRLQEVIGYGDTPNDPFGRWGGYLNTGGGLARGIELSGEARPSRKTMLQATYTYTNADERQSSLTGGGLSSIRVFPHQVTAVLTQQVTPRLNVTADWWWANQYIGGTFFLGSGIRPYLFEGPRKLDASAVYAVPVNDRLSLKLFVRAENLLNQRYFEEGFHTPRAWATAGVKLLF